METDMTARVIYLSLILASLGAWFIAEFRGRMGQGTRMLLAWGAIFVAVMAGYGIFTDLRSSQTTQQRTEGDSITVQRQPDGHFYLVLEVDGQPIEFMVDTGASNIVLGSDVAEDLGIDTAGLAYLGEASTANGVVRTARVRLETVRLGPFTDTRVAAYVTDGQMDGALLGMDYLRHFRMEIDGNQMVLQR